MKLTNLEVIRNILFYADLSRKLNGKTKIGTLVDHQLKLRFSEDIITLMQPQQEAVEEGMQVEVKAKQRVYRVNML